MRKTWTYGLISAGLGGILAVSSVAIGQAPGSTTGYHLPSPPPTVAAMSSLDIESVARAERPHIIQRPIPYGAKRKNQMAKYSKFHYGTAAWLLQPRGVVQHFTATNSLRSVMNTFASNAPDPELGQKPGVCTQFVIDRDGRILQLVPEKVRCRHTVGLNHQMIGVEHVGLSDRAVMSSQAQRTASLQLTLWLMSRYDISLGDVIGHNENRSSRFHKELYRPWRCQTHGDFRRGTMNDYRDRLRDSARVYGLDTSAPSWRRTGC